MAGMWNKLKKSLSFKPSPTPSQSAPPPQSDMSAAKDISGSDSRSTVSRSSSSLSLFSRSFSARSSKVIFLTQFCIWFYLILHFFCLFSLDFIGFCMFCLFYAISFSYFCLYTFADLNSRRNSSLLYFFCRFLANFPGKIMNVRPAKIFSVAKLKGLSIFWQISLVLLWKFCCS